MKKLLCIMLILLVCLLPGCNSQKQYSDGIYFVQSDDYDSEGWMDAVLLDIEDGKIIDAEWTAFHESGDLDRQRLLPELSPQSSGGNWQSQADAVAMALVLMQDVTALTGEGSGDILNGITIRIDEFVVLVNRALELAK